HDGEEDGTSSPRASTTARSCHDKLCETLRKKMTTNEKGVMYVYYDTNNRESGYKIGWTRRAYEIRVAEQRKRCGILPIVVHVSDHQIECCARLERLVHLDLQDHNRPRCCDNRKHDTRIHTDWFNVTGEMAIQTVKRWEDFIHREKPYGCNGELKPIWRHLLQKRSSVSLDIRTFTHEARRDQWMSILAPPSAADYFEVYRKTIGAELGAIHNSVACAWLYSQTFFWQMITLLYGLVTLALCRNMMALYAFTFFLGCASVSVLGHVPLASPKLRPKTPVRI
ncbi:hypothetical protein BDW02DRAFT_475189, partial [Decorospora gaudefroyi]